MKGATIENPIINTPWRKPTRHFKFSEDGITEEIEKGRRRSSCFIPIAQPRGKDKTGQRRFETEWTQDRFKENEPINRIRECVGLWRGNGYKGITKTSRRPLECEERNPGRNQGKGKEHS